MTRGINLAIGPSCYTKCGGCYNHFSGSARTNSTVSGDKLLEFIDRAKHLDPEQVTIHGGDPLSHPDFIKIVRGSHQRGLRVKVDTVGTPFLEDADVIFYGNGSTSRLNMQEALPWVHQWGIPVDGSTNEIGALFRAGRAKQVDEAFEIIRRMRDGGACSINVNTVVHKGNLGDITAIVERVARAGLSKVQLFQFQPTGPIAHRNSDRYMITHDEFSSAVDRARLVVGASVEVEAKSARDRDGFYFLVDDQGVAYVPNGPGKIRIGHIEEDAARVLGALEWHFSPDKSTTIGRVLRGLDALTGDVGRDAAMLLLSVIEGR